ncbi:MAG: YafY family transcriptional regulator [Clostridiales bacterium]|jgi:predicted DNA-binding transcriptional regulator YafY|nr:YafY family transcriptional regulator [Clostridiales bacterium]
MKTDRLLSIVIYLLSHDKVSAEKLAERFEVSRRTIVRNIEQISMAGIPIKSLSGPKGGYSIMEGYKLDGRVIKKEEQQLIITAIKGFLSAYDGKRYAEVLEKLMSLFLKQQKGHIFLDFGATGENNETQEKLKSLEEAIVNKKAVQILYVNAEGYESKRYVEPLALNYRWYAWYLLAFCHTKQDYRIFKLVRISRLQLTRASFLKKHADADVLLEQAFQEKHRKSIDVTLLCRAEIKVQIKEYLGGEITETFENGDFILSMRVFEDERIWFAVLLSFADKIKVIKPDEIRDRLTKTAENILSLYDN